MTITLELPFPVSVNAMYKNVGKRRAVSQRYRDWKTAAGWALKAQYRGTPIVEPIMLQIALSPPCNRKRDLDNLAKGIQDLLTGTVIQDDSQIKLLFLWWEDKVKGGEARVMIDPLSCKQAQDFIASHANRNLPQVIESANKLSDGTATGNSRPSAKSTKAKGGQHG